MVLLVYAITIRIVKFYLGFLPFLLVFVFVLGTLGLLLKLGRELELLNDGLLLLLLFLITGLLLLIVGSRS